MSAYELDELQADVPDCESWCSDVATKLRNASNCESREVLIANLSEAEKAAADLIREIRALLRKAGAK